jgi:hypothetical protein
MKYIIEKPKDSSLREHIRCWLADCDNNDDHDGEFNVAMKDDAYLILQEIKDLLDDLDRSVTIVNR